MNRRQLSSLDRELEEVRLHLDLARTSAATGLRILDGVRGKIDADLSPDRDPEPPTRPPRAEPKPPSEPSDVPDVTVEFMYKGETYRIGGSQGWSPEALGRIDAKGGWRPCSNEPDTWLGPICGDIAPVLTRSHGTVHIMLVNAFPDVGEVTVEKLHGPGGLQAPSVTIPPGYWFAYEAIDGDDFPIEDATAEGVENAHRHDAPIMSVGHRYVMGGKDANEGGGQLIYPNIEWWAGCPAGIIECLDITLGYANRSAFFRWDREAFAEGRIERWRGPETYGYWQGLDRSRLIAAQSYGGTGVLVDKYLGHEQAWDLDGYDQLDHQHLVRLLHVAGFAARQGYAFARLVLKAAAEDVYLSWCVPNSNDGKANLTWWSCYGILEHWPKGVGCAITGREFAGALFALSYAVELNLGDRYREGLELLLRTAWHVYDQDDRLLNVLDPLNPVTEAMSNQWKHKVQEESGKASGDNIDKRHRIPAGKHPRVQKRFEEALIRLALIKAVAVLRDTSTSPHSADWDDRMGTMILGLTFSLRERNNWLYVPDHPEWSSPAQQAWTDLTLGDASGYDLKEEMAKHPFYSGASVVSAYSGNLP